MNTHHYMLLIAAISFNVGLYAMEQDDSLPGHIVDFHTEVAQKVQEGPSLNTAYGDEEWAIATECREALICKKEQQDRKEEAPSAKHFFELLKKHPSIVHYPHDGWDDESLLVTAIRHKKLSAIVALLRAGADSNKRRPGIVLRAEKVIEEDGRKVVVSASRKDNVLLDSPLCVAAGGCYISAMKVLLKDAWKADVNVADGGITPLMRIFASNMGHGAEGVSLLLEKEANPNITDNYKNNALHHAILGYNNKLESNSGKKKPLTEQGLRRIEQQYLDAIEMLLQKNAQNVPNAKGKTPLDLAKDIKWSKAEELITRAITECVKK